MAKLERVTAKIFASDAPADKIGQFGSALAGTKLETGDVSTIQALPAYTEGWSSAVISQRNYPVLQETNGVMKNMSYQTAYIMQNGIAEYDPDTEYYAGSICKGIGNTNQYASWGDENVGNAVTNSDYWKNVTPVNYSNITNCLLEVPQRIKLELNEGVLTLKAGSEVIVPNGFEEDGVTPKFDYVTVESDSTVKNGANEQEIILSENGNITGGVPSAWAYSGATQPTVSTKFAIWYDTANNKIKLTMNNGSTWVEGLSLPIALATSSTTQYTSIDQVFNGMGYIGSTVWVDKGVKGLIPNGRNEDGSLNNIEHITQKLITRDVTDNGSLELAITSYDVLNVYSYFSVSDENYLIGNNGDVITGFSIIEVYNTNNVITSFNPKQPFRAVDYSDYVNDIDGKYTYKNPLNISSQENLKVENGVIVDYNLSKFLPKDNNSYLVSTYITVRTGASTGAYCHVWTTSSDNINCVSCGGNTTNSYRQTFVAGGWTLVRPDRILRTFRSCTGSAGILYRLEISSYRKVR